MSDYSEGNAEQEAVPSVLPEFATLYLRLPTETGTLFPKTRAIINMFPGRNKVVVYFADTRQRRGAQCALDARMLTELKSVLGEENVVVK